MCLKMELTICSCCIFYIENNEGKSRRNISGFIITLLNILFVIISVLLIVGGVIVYTSSDIGLFTDMEDTIQTNLNSLASDTGSSTGGIQGFSILECLHGIGIVLIISGSVLLVLSFCGYCGGYFQIKTLICIHGFITGVLLIVEIIVVILMYAVPSTIQGNIKDVLLNSLKQYKGIGNSDVNTLAWMFAMNKMKCCGVNGYTDFSTYATNWDRTPRNVSSDIDAPLVCCKTAPTSLNATCARILTLDINEEGCFDVVWNTVLGNPVYAGVGFGLGFILQLLFIIFAVMMLNDIVKKNKVNPEPVLHDIKNKKDDTETQQDDNAVGKSTKDIKNKKDDTETQQDDNAVGKSTKDNLL